MTISSIARDESGISIAWEASSPELQFTVEQRHDLNAGAWEPFPNVSWPVRTNRVLVPITESSAQLYRVSFDPVPGERGRLISSTNVATLDRALIQLVFDGGGYPIEASQDVAFFKLLYETVDAQGLPTEASGALALPVGATNPLPLVSYQHGTIVLREDVPSRLSLEGLVAIAYATSGYAAVAPDYLGLGDSPGVHPFHHSRSEATSVIDLLRAARGFASANAIALDSRLFLTGYSLGGHATLATLREIEAHHSDEFSVTACGAGAGAYDLSGTTLNRVLQGATVPNPYYYPYLLAAYVDVYEVANSLGDLLRLPWRTTIPPLFDGLHESDVINAALPSVPLDVFDPNQVSALSSDPNHPLRVALRENDLFNWTPRAPLRLYRCSGDQDVDPQNSVVAFNQFQARGATQVQLLDPSPGADHGACAVPTLLDAKAWFDSLR